MPRKVQRFVAEKANLMRPRAIYICDGSQEEVDSLIHKLVERGMLSKLVAYENNYICRTDPKVTPSLSVCSAFVFYEVFSML